MKEIIISGVNVGGCACLGDPHYCMSRDYPPRTKCANVNCDYKKWKQTQKQLDIAGKVIVEMTEKQDKILQENKELKIKVEELEKWTGLYDTCGKKICYGNIVHWTDGGDDLTLEQRIKERWDRIAVVGRYITDDNIVRPEICFNTIDSPSEITKNAAPEFSYGCFIYKDTENYLTIVAENYKEYKKKFKNAGECMAYVLEVKNEVGSR